MGCLSLDPSAESVARLLTMWYNALPMLYQLGSYSHILSIICCRADMSSLFGWVTMAGVHQQSSPHQQFSLAVQTQSAALQEQCLFEHMAMQSHMSLEAT